MELKSGCVRIKLKENCLDEVEKWAKTLNNRKKEVIETMQREGIYIESVFLDHIGKDNYLIYYLRMENFEKAAKVIRHSEHEIDKYHNIFKKNCWDTRVPLRKLIDISR